MILDLNAIKRKGKDSEDFFFLYEPNSELVDIPNAKLIFPVKINGNITLTGEHTALISGEVAYSISGECTRCLKDTERQYIASFEEECSADNPNGYLVENDKIYLNKIADDTILTSIPVSFLCKDDCKGICAGCGVNLNDGDCKCNK